MEENKTEEVETTEPEPVEIVNPTEYDMQMSETIGELAGALAKAQGEMKSVNKGAQGYGYKYADLAAVIETAKPALSKHGLSIVQTHTLKRNATNPSVVTQTLLMHSSGEWIKSSLDLPIIMMKQLTIVQCIGLVSSYGRRYSYQAIVGIAAEEDNDASDKQ